MARNCTELGVLVLRLWEKNLTVDRVGNVQELLLATGFHEVDSLSKRGPSRR